MSYRPINLSIPGVGMIAVLGKRYETLTDDFIQQWMCDLVQDYLVEPDYLLVTEQVRHDLYCLVMSDLHLHRWAVEHARNDKGERVETYPNKVTGKALTVVEFPGLPEKTLMAGSLLEIREETVRVDGLSRIVTRVYAGINENHGLE